MGGQDRMERCGDSLQAEDLVADDSLPQPAHRHPRHPINRIPPELLSIVFEHCLPSVLVDHIPKDQDAPLLFTQVCALWRVVAHQTPVLWNRISITVPGGQVPNARVASLTDGIRQWVERSGSLPIYVRLSGEASTQLNTRASNGIVDAIVPHAERLRVLHLFSPVQVIMERFMTTKAVRLKHCEITGVVHTGTNEFHVVPSRLGALSTLYLSGGFHAKVTSPGTLTHLRKIDLRCRMSLDHCLALIRQSPSLEDFGAFFWCSNANSLIPDSYLAVEAPSLKQLRVGRDIVNSELLNSLVTPKLKSLTIYDHNTLLMSAATNLVSRSGCSIETFTSSGRQFTNSIVTFFKESPRISQLRIRGEILCPVLLHEMTIHEGKDTLLPSLESLEIGGYGCLVDEESVSLLITMVQSRLANSTPLTKVGTHPSLCERVHNKASVQGYSLGTVVDSIF